MEKIELQDVQLHNAYRFQKKNVTNIITKSEGYEIYYYPGSHIAIDFKGKGISDGTTKIVSLGNVVGMTAAKEEKKAKK